MLMVKCDACKKKETTKNSDVYWTDWRIVKVYRTSDVPVSGDLHICPDCYQRIGELMNLFTTEPEVDADVAGND